MGGECCGGWEGYERTTYCGCSSVYIFSIAECLEKYLSMYIYLNSSGLKLTPI